MSTGYDFDFNAVRDETGRALEGPFKHLRVLERRMQYLGQRIDKGRREGKVLSHDQHEHEALEWAISAIYQWVDLPKEE